MNKNITLERFKKWLARLPKTRTFNFYSGLPDDKNPCCFCAFLKSLGMNDFWVGGSTFDIEHAGRRRTYKLPPWFTRLGISSLPPRFTVAQVQERLKRL